MSAESYEVCHGRSAIGGLGEICVTHGVKRLPPKGRETSSVRDLSCGSARRDSPSYGESGRLRENQAQTAGALPEDDGQGPGEGWFYAQAMAPLSWKPLGSGEPAGYVALKPTFAVPPGPIVAMYTAGVSVAWSPLRVRVELNG